MLRKIFVPRLPLEKKCDYSEMFERYGIVVTFVHGARYFYKGRKIDPNRAWYVLMAWDEIICGLDPRIRVTDDFHCPCPIELRRHHRSNGRPSEHKDDVVLRSYELFDNDPRPRVLANLELYLVDGRHPEARIFKAGRYRIIIANWFRAAVIFAALT